MKANKISSIFTMVLLLSSFASCFLLFYYFDNNTNSRDIKELLINISIGIFTGSFLSFIITFTNYNICKRQNIAEFVSIVNCLNVLLMPFYNVYKVEAERNNELENFLIQKWYDFLFENYHKTFIQFSFFFKKNKKLMNELYIRIVNTVEIKYKYDFNLVTLENYDKERLELFAFLRSYKDELYVNVLNEKHKTLCKLSKLKFDNNEQYKA